MLLSRTRAFTYFFIVCTLWLLAQSDPLLEWRAQYDQALAKNSKAEFLALESALRKSKAPDTILLALTCRRLGSLYLNTQTAPDSAKFYLKEAVRLLNNNPKAAYGDLAASYFNLGKLYYQSLFDADSSLLYFQNAIQVREMHLDSSAFLVDTYVIKATLCMERGDYESADQLFKKASALSQAKQYSDRLYSILHEQALLCQLRATGSELSKRTWLLKANDLLKRALSAYATTANAQGYIRAMADLGSNYIRLDDSLDAARSILEEALRLSDKKQVDLYRIAIRNNLGIVYTRLKQHRNAQTVFESLIRELTPLPSSQQELAQTYDNFGACYMSLGAFEKANSCFQKALSTAIPDFEPQNPGVLPTVNHCMKSPRQSDLLVYLFDNARALRLLHLKNGNRNHLHDALQSGLLFDSLAHEIQTNLIHRNSKLHLSEKLAEGYEESLATTEKLYGLTKDTLYFNLALQFCEKSKARLLREHLHRELNIPFRGVPQFIIDTESKFLKEIAKIENRRPTLPDSLASMLESELLFLSDSFATWRWNVLHQYAEYYKLRYDNFDMQTLSRIRHNLRENEAFLEYFVGDSSTFVLGVTRQAQVLWKIPWSQEFNDEVLEFRQSIQTPDFNNSKGNALLNTGYARLIEPVLKPLTANGPITRLSIVRDGVLEHIPFEVFNTGTSNEPKYLIEDIAVHYLPSADFTAIASKKGNNAAGQLTFAGSYANTSGYALRQLPNAIQEGKAIIELTGGKAYFDQAASKAAFLKEAGNFDAIHLALHGIYNEQSPLQSSLIFPHSGSEENAALTAGEIFNLSLHARLVVLSACQSGTGILRRGEGLIGLARAFMYAGCSSLVVSQWNAEDRSSLEIMTSFYKNLKSGQDKDFAMQEAKRSFLKKHKGLSTQHPAYWAGFVLIGDPQSVTFEPQSFSKGILIALGALMLLVLSLLYWKNNKFNGAK